MALLLPATASASQPPVLQLPQRAPRLQWHARPLDLRVPHGPDNPFNYIDTSAAAPAFILVGAGLVLASLVFSGLALSRSKKMEEAETRTELTGYYEEQKVFGTLGYSLFGGGAAVIVIGLVAPK